MSFAVIFSSSLLLICCVFVFLSLSLSLALLKCTSLWSCLATGCESPGNLAKCWHAPSSHDALTTCQTHEICCFWMLINYYYFIFVKILVTSWEVDFHLALSLDRNPNNRFQFFRKTSVQYNLSQTFCLSTEASACPTPSSPTVLEEDSVQFNKLSYLGCTWVKAPRNEGEAQRAMATLRAESAIPIPITLHVPCGPDGSVR